MDTLKTTLADVQTKVNAVEGSVNEFDIKTVNMKVSTLDNLTNPPVKRNEFTHILNKNGATCSSNKRPSGINDGSIVYRTFISIEGACLIQYLNLSLTATKGNTIDVIVQPFVRLTFDDQQYVFSLDHNQSCEIGFVAYESFLHRENFKKFPSSKVFGSQGSDYGITPLQGALYCKKKVKIEYGLWKKADEDNRYGAGVSGTVEYIMI